MSSEVLRSNFFMTAQLQLLAKKTCNSAMEKVRARNSLDDFEVTCL